jgi:hypothetical protein
MKFAFIDECYFSFRNKPYTAAVASLWEADALPSFRSAFIDTIGTAINCDPNQINAFPTIHAAEMAKEYDDDIKLLCFETIARLTLVSIFIILGTSIAYRFLPVNPTPLMLSITQIM